MNSITSSATINTHTKSTSTKGLRIPVTGKRPIWQSVTVHIIDTPLSKPLAADCLKLDGIGIPIKDARQLSPSEFIVRISALNRFDFATTATPLTTKGSTIKTIQWSNTSFLTI